MDAMTNRTTQAYQHLLKLLFEILSTLKQPLPVQGYFNFLRVLHFLAELCDLGMHVCGRWEGRVTREEVENHKPCGFNFQSSLGDQKATTSGCEPTASKQPTSDAFLGTFDLVLLQLSQLLFHQVDLAGLLSVFRVILQQGCHVGYQGDDFRAGGGHCCVRVCVSVVWI